MKTRFSYLLIICLLILLVILALLAPQAADRWYDGQTLGQLSYEKMDYEPYDISPYHSFAEKMDAIAGAMEEGIPSYTVKLKEKGDAPQDQELIEIVNEELGILYEKGILPYELSIENLMERTFYQIYVMPVENEVAPLLDACFWRITGETENGKIMLAMDSTYYKIYGITMSDEMKNIQSDVEPWMEKQQVDSYVSLTKSWCSYWGIENSKIKSIYGDGTKAVLGNHGQSDAEEVVGYGAESGSIIVLSSGHQFYVWNWLQNPLMYGKQVEWTWVTGMGQMINLM